MNFKDYLGNEDLTFEAVLKKLKKVNPLTELREECIKATGMAEVTFWYKIRNGFTFSEQEKTLIANVIGKPINVLFP